MAVQRRCEVLYSYLILLPTFWNTVYTHFLFVVVRMIFQILYLGGTFPYALIASLLSFGYSLDALVSMCIYVFPKFEEARKNPVSYKKSKLNKRSSAWKSTTNLQEEEDLKLLVCTANIGNAEPTQESMEAWIPLRGSCKVVTNLDDKRMRAGIFDMIVIGMQESTWNETASSRQQSKKEVSEEDILSKQHNIFWWRGGPTRLTQGLLLLSHQTPWRIIPQPCFEKCYKIFLERDILRLPRTSVVKCDYGFGLQTTSWIKLRM